MTVASVKSAVNRFSFRNWTRLVTPAFFAFSFASRMRYGVDVDAGRLDAVAARGGDRDAAVARAEVVQHVALLHVGEAQHVIDDILRGRYENDIRGLGRGLALGLRADERRSGESERCRERDDDGHAEIMP